MNSTSLPPVSINRLAALLAARKSSSVSSTQSLEIQSEIAPAQSNTQPSVTPSYSPQESQSSVGMHGEAISYNEEQSSFINLASAGSSCILVGAAGTGKTTCMRGAAAALIQSGLLPIFSNVTHKHLPASGVPGIIFCAYTRRAAANLRKALPLDLQQNCITIHKLLEYEPTYYDVTDPATGETKVTMRFEPARNPYNTLPDAIHTIVIDESSMVSVELFKEITAALSHSVQFIFLGDIQQLPPVFGSAILGYKMLELPTVELTQVYRQALESPIIRLAHRILSGVPITSTDFDEWHFPDQLRLHPWKKKLHPEIACLTFSRFITQALDHGSYNSESDIILCPFNKSFGTDEINKQVANHIAKTQERDVYEIIAGFNKAYFSIGDKVLFDKEDAIIVSIKPNRTYTGKQPQPHSPNLDYWGHSSSSSSTQTLESDEVDFILSQAASSSDDEDRVNKASHSIELKRLDSDTSYFVDTASGINSLSLGYAITVHKSQGSEWEKVFIVFHQSHATMLQRELLYTAVTRAKKELYVICEPETFVKGIQSQRIPGNTLQEKAVFFQGKKDQQN